MWSRDSYSTAMMPGVTADELRDWMERHGWSVRELARALDMSPASIQRYRSGRREIPRVFEIALRELQRREGDQER